MKIKIEAIKPLASQRTKNRIRANGPWFTLERKHTDGVLLLVDAKDGPHAQKRLQSWLLRGNDWLGWLPINEFRITEKSA